MTTAGETSFESLIIKPIFCHLDSCFLTTDGPLPSDVGAPLLEREPRPAIETSTSFENLGIYLDTMRHCLLHESYHSLIHDYNSNLGSQGRTIPLEVIKVKNHGREIRCAIDYDDIDRISESMSASIGMKSRADYLISENSVGIFSTDDKDIIASVTHRRGNGRLRTYSLDLLLTTPLSSTAKTIEFQQFSSFTTARRQFDALAKVGISSFRNIIIDPRSTVLQGKSECDDDRLAIMEAPLNPSQRRAVTAAAAMVINPNLWTPWMTLVQGPPGTGKSQTVAALIELLVTMDPSFSRGPIVVCAPSNSAVDQLLGRVVRAEWATPLLIDDGGGSRRLFRIGVESKIASEAHRFFPTQANPVDIGIIFTTLNSAGSFQLEDLPKPAVVVIDEAGQSTELDFWIPIVMHKTNKVFVIGDPLQLSPTVLSEEARRHGLKRSFMERFYCRLKMDGELDEMFKLNIQYRMHPDICQFPSRRFYNDSLKTAPQVFQREKEDIMPFPPYRVADVDQSMDGVASRGSRSNMKEADEVVGLIVEMLKVTSDYSIGVATPYVAQVSLIIKLLKNIHITEDGVMKKGSTILGAIMRLKSDRGGGRLPFLNHGDSLHAYVDVKTVDAFQGDERDIVIISCVRAFPDDKAHSSGIGFVADRQRMNVALTRARRSLYIIGNFQSLSVNSDWEALYQNAINRERLFRKKTKTTTTMMTTTHLAEQ